MGSYESPVHFGDFDVQMVLIQKANLSKSDSKHRKSPKIWIMIVIMVASYVFLDITIALLPTAFHSKLENTTETQESGHYYPCYL